MNRAVNLHELGSIDYKQCWDYQTRLFEATVQQKIKNRKNPDLCMGTENHLIFCEHPHVYTLGKSGLEDNLLLSKSDLTEKKIDFYPINRGGDITYHGPGQWVVYPIFDLDHFFTDIHKYLRYLEEAVIKTIADYGILGYRIEEFTGVWVGEENPRKICALGVKSSRWVTMHGIGFNVNTDLSYFNYIIPCGIEDKAVTSMRNELGRKMDMSEVKERLIYHLSSLFQFTLNS